MKANDESTARNAIESAVSFQREDIRRLIRGELPINLAIDFLRQTTEEQVDAKAISLFVDVISETAVDAGNELKNIDGAMDCCGTGGSGLPHFNTSTTVAFVLAAAGVRTAKFGNRAAVSLSGRFDLLGKLDIGGTVPIAAMPALFEETNLLFLFAQQFYPGLATIAPVRQLLGSRSIFNLIGPLLNPVHPHLRLLGTPQIRAHELLVEYLKNEGHVTRACVVTSSAGLDELEVGETNLVSFVDRKEKKVDEFYFGEQVSDKPWGAISANECVRVFRALLKNEIDTNSYYYRIVCLNAGAALHVAGLAQDIESGYELASLLFKQGEVANKFEQYRSAHARYSN